MKPVQLLPIVLTTACTSLGPMPSTTAVSAVPHGRPGVEVSAGVVPGFMLSDAAYKVRGTPQGQISALVEPDRVIGLPGLIAGARSVGSDDNTIFEPMLGYRRKLDDSISLAGVGYGTKASGEGNYATYEATRVGAEVAVDAKLGANSWVGVHLQAAVSATVLSAQGSYCVDPQGVGTDCDGDASDRRVEADVDGVYATASSGLSLDFLRDKRHAIHVARVALLLTVGSMPRVRDGIQEKGDAFVSGGMTLTFGLGSAD